MGETDQRTDMSKPHWRPARTSDLVAISAIAARIHPDLPESPDVFAEKIRLYPDGCRLLIADEEIAGYGLAHPWKQHRIPPLNGFLQKLPDDADCLYVHDVAVLPDFRGGIAPDYIADIEKLARASHITTLALVSVYATPAVMGASRLPARRGGCGGARKARLLWRRRDLHASRPRCDITSPPGSRAREAAPRTAFDHPPSKVCAGRSGLAEPRLENFRETHIVESCFDCIRCSGPVQRNQCQRGAGPDLRLRFRLLRGLRYPGRDADPGWQKPRQPHSRHLAHLHEADRPPLQLVDA